MKYQKNPTVVDAVQLRWDTWDEVCNLAPVGLVLTDDGWTRAATPGQKQRRCRGVFVSPHDLRYSDEAEWGDPRIGLLIPSYVNDLPINLLAVEGDYVIRRADGEFTKLPADLFEATHQPIGTKFPG